MHVAYDMLYFFDYLTTHLSSFMCIPFRDRLACLVSSSSSEDPVDRNASTSDGANVPVKVMYICSVSFWGTNR